MLVAVPKSTTTTGSAVAALRAATASATRSAPYLARIRIARRVEQVARRFGRAHHGAMPQHLRSRRAPRIGQRRHYRCQAHARRCPGTKGPRNSSSGISFTRSSSHVWCLFVATRQRWLSFFPSYTPTTVCVLPTSIAKSILSPTLSRTAQNAALHRFCPRRTWRRCPSSRRAPAPSGFFARTSIAVPRFLSAPMLASNVFLTGSERGRQCEYSYVARMLRQRRAHPPALPRCAAATRAARDTKEAHHERIAFTHLWLSTTSRRSPSSSDTP